jgi:hypothetical protein
MKDERQETLVLGSDKVLFLEEMAKTYGLPDIGKAVRCLIDYAREHPASRKTSSTRSAAWTARSPDGWISYQLPSCQLKGAPRLL